ncbi:MAG: insulinase family protein [Deltaproteobacteria bacterium]|nr:insulinase family protein [Deltaproteobacteria bacterium]
MKTTLHTLDNGLTVLLEENHSAPVIALNLLVKVGSAMEQTHEAGISHFIEHMLFKGTPTRPTGEIAHDVEAAGGDINAYTSFDQTVYYINMASRYADEGLAILADAVQHPLFASAEITREAEVICEEIRRSEDNPGHQLSEFLFAHTYGTHPYGRPIIGSVKTVKSFTQRDLRNYWERWYTPDNMVFIAVGALETEVYCKKLQALFGKMPRRQPPAVTYPSHTIAVDTPQTHLHRANIESHYFALSFPIPSITHADIPALDILSHILGGSDSSRLELQVKEVQQLVQSIYSYAYTPRGAGLFLVGGTANTRQMTRALPAIRGEIDRLCRTAVSTAELSRAKLNITSTALYERETVGGQGGKYAYVLATVGNHTFEEQYFEAIRRTTAEEIRKAAGHYLDARRATLTWLAPKEATVPTGVKTRQLIRTSVKTRSARRSAMKRLRPHLFALPNGLRVIVRPEHRLPLLACKLFMVGGTRHETPQTNGINTLLAATMTKGTLLRDARMIAESTDAIAGDVGAAAGLNTFGIRAEFLSEKLSEGLALFSEIVRQPAFARVEVAKEQTQQLEAIRNQKDNLPSLALLHFCKALFGTHPYALPRLGTAASVRRLSHQTLAHYYRRLLQPQQMVLALSGDIELEMAQELITHYFHDLTAQKVAAIRLRPMAPVEPVTVVTHRRERQQAHLIYGVRGSTVTAPERYALAVLNQILAGQGGRLFRTLRDRMSLAYAVHASHQLGIDPGYFSVYIGTEPSKLDHALDGIKHELARLTDDLVSQTELRRAQQYLVGTYELDLQRNDSVAAIHALDVLYELGLDAAEKYASRILAVTPKDLLRVAQRYFREDRAVCSIVRP